MVQILSSPLAIGKQFIWPFNGCTVSQIPLILPLKELGTNILFVVDVGWWSIYIIITNIKFVITFDHWFSSTCRNFPTYSKGFTQLVFRSERLQLFDASPDFDHYYDVHFPSVASQPQRDNDNCVSDQQLLCMLVKVLQLHALLVYFYGCGFFCRTINIWFIKIMV